MSAAAKSLTTKETDLPCIKSRNVISHVPVVLRKLLEDMLRQETEDMGNLGIQWRGEAISG